MWAKTFEQRLTEWNQLRAECSALPKDRALERINFWWHQTPWCPYRLHWDLQDEWPTPWEILEDNYYCPLTRALGICYTIAITGIVTSAELVATQAGDHLIIVDNGQHILNWDANTTVNIELPAQIVHRLSLDYFSNKI